MRRQLNKPISLTQTQPSSVSLNLNSILSAVVLAVVGWVGMKTANNSDTLVEVKTSQPYLTQGVNELKTQLAALVTRAEFDSRLSEAKSERVALESRIHTLEIELKAANITQQKPK